MFTRGFVVQAKIRCHIDQVGSNTYTIPLKDKGTLN